MTERTPWPSTNDTERLARIDDLLTLNGKSPQQKIADIAEAIRMHGDRCMANPLLSGTWVEESFYGLAEIVAELADEQLL